MRIKSKDIARELGISTATVSLAVNGRPGVNPETRERVLACIREKEEAYYRTFSRPEEHKGTIVMVSYWKHGAVLSRSASAFSAFRELAERAGYELKVYRFQEQRHVEESLLARLKADEAKGIYLMGAEMEKEDISPFLSLDIPVVAGDHDFYEYGLDSYLIDNYEGISNAVQYLLRKGHTDIVYLSESVEIFNFRERRQAFIEVMEANGCGRSTNRIIELGRQTEEVYASMKAYLEHDRRLPTACILESSVISLGVSKALLEAGISVPEELSLIGFDALPDKALPGFKLTCIKGTHTARHLAAMRRVIERIETAEDERIKIYYKPKYINGTSVKDISGGRSFK